MHPIENYGINMTIGYEMDTTWIFRITIMGQVGL